MGIGLLSRHPLVTTELRAGQCPGEPGVNDALCVRVIIFPYWLYSLCLFDRVAMEEGNNEGVSQSVSNLQSLGTS